MSPQPDRSKDPSILARCERCGANSATATGTLCRACAVIDDAEGALWDAAYRFGALTDMCDHCLALLPRVGVHDNYWWYMRDELNRRNL